MLAEKDEIRQQKTWEWANEPFRPEFQDEPLCSESRDLVTGYNRKCTYAAWDYWCSREREGERACVCGIVLRTDIKYIDKYWVQELECVVMSVSQSSTRYQFSVMCPFHHCHVLVFNVTLNLKRAKCDVIVTNDPGTDSFIVAPYSKFIACWLVKWHLFILRALP